MRDDLLSQARRAVNGNHIAQACGPERRRIDHALGDDHFISVARALRVEDSAPLTRQVQMLPPLDVRP